MSLYREAGAVRRRRRLTIAAAVAAVLLAGVVVVLLATGDDGPPSPAERAASSRRAAQEALSGLELLQIEYGQAVRAGRIVAPTEYEAAKADVERATAAITGRAEDIDVSDPGARVRILAALRVVGAAVAARQDKVAVDRAVEGARAQLELLGR